MKRTILFLFSLLALTALACGSVTQLPEQTDPNGQQSLPTLAPATMEPEVEGDPNAVHTITIINRTGRDVCHVFIVPGGQSEWGEDLLGQEDIIPTDFEQDFTMGTGKYDLLLLDCEQEVVQEQLGLEVNKSESWEIKN